MKKIINCLLIALASYFIVRQIIRYYRHGVHIFFQSPEDKTRSVYYNFGYEVGYFFGANGGLVAVLIILSIVVYRKFFKKQ
jgi:hypothetical protein